MHEYSIVEALLVNVQGHVDRARARSVRRLVVSVGERAGLDPVLFRRAFETFRERTPCEHAELQIVDVPVRWECARCAARLASPMTACMCGGRARLGAGDDIVLDRIEMEVG